MLACVRDQINLTIDSYRNLYESSIAFGIRKAVNADKHKSEMKSKIEGLKLECNNLERDVNSLKNKIDLAKRAQEESRKQREEEHQKKVEELKKKNDFLKDELELKLSSKTKQRKRK